MSIIKALTSSRKFWLAVFGVVQTLVFQYLPQFPKEVWQSINTLIVILISAIAIEDAGAAIGSK